MKSTFAHFVLGAGVFFAVTLPAFAAPATHDTSASLPSPAAVRASAQAYTLPPTASPNELFANPNRAYPPSCLNSPLPLHLYQNDPNAITGLVKLPGDAFSASTAEQSYTETDAVTIFRVPCAGGKSALLVEVDRPTTVDGNTTTYPVYPLVYVVISGGTGVALRTAADPNTFLSDNVSGVPIYKSSVFVVENTYQSSLQFDFNQAVSIYVNNLFAASDPNEDTLRYDFATYNPAQYAAASQPLPISGYETGTWYDPLHSGEGIQTEVGEVSTAGTQRFLSISWYTYDSTGTPYWLIGSGVFNIGANAVNNIQLAYTSGGGFAGNFGASVNKALWGTISVDFPDCNTMVFNYANAAGLPDGVPTGNGSKTWKRLTGVNGLTCQ